MPQKFAHLLPIDVEVWLRFLNLHGKGYTLFEYDVRVGLGREVGPEFEANIRQMALDLSLRRIDCVAHTSTEITVIEITHSAGFKALGQVTGYPILYALTFPPLLPIKSLLVCGELQSDIKPIIDSLNIPHVVV